MTYDKSKRALESIREITSSHPASVARKTTKPIKQTEWDATIQEVAEVNDLDPALIASILHQESRFNPKAVSPAGAKGIAQFMPETAKDYGIDPFDPHESIRALGKYIVDIKSYLDRKTGKDTPLPFVLGAYNWGMGKMSKWINRNGHVPPPVKETMNYMNEIPARVENYAYLRNMDSEAMASEIMDVEAETLEPTEVNLEDIDIADTDLRSKILLEEDLGKEGTW